MRSVVSKVLPILALSGFVAIGAITDSVAMGSMTSHKVDWKYVQDALGGMAVGDPLPQGKKVILPIRFYLKPTVYADSAYTIRKVKARINNRDIQLTVVMGLVGGQPAPDHIVLKGVKAGTYNVIYLDPDGGQYSLGSIEVKR